jgi:carbonic anhydrase
LVGFGKEGVVRYKESDVAKDGDIMTIEELLAGHQKFKIDFEAEAELFRRLAREGQSPKVLWIGCSDSRVIPEQITGARAGDMFVMRNVANVVPPCQKHDAAGAVIEYAVQHLGVRDIIICGHTKCGGIKALDDDIDKAPDGHIARWLETARPAREMVEKLSLPPEELYLETIKANVLLQQMNLLTYPCIREAIDKGLLKTHGWLYDLCTGDITAYDDESSQWRTLAASEKIS